MSCNNASMDQVPAPTPEPQPSQRSNALALILVVLAIGGSAVGVFFYQTAQNSRKTTIDASGFDLNQTTESKPIATTQSQTQTPQSSMMISNTGMGQMKFGIGAG